MIRDRLMRRQQIGEAPGTIAAPTGAIETHIDLTVFDASEIHRTKDATVDQCTEAARNDRVAWVNVVGLSDAELIDDLAERFGLHDLAAEDVVNTHQRPKLEEYGEHLYIVVRMPRLMIDEGQERDDIDAGLDLEQVSLFIGDGWLLTFQERPGDCFDNLRKRLRNPKRLVRQRGSDFLGYAIIDSIVDSYFPVVADYAERIDEIEDRLMLLEEPIDLIGRLHRIRTEIRELRRTAWSHRDLLRSLMNYGGTWIQDDTRLHLRDVSDHTLQLVELLESNRDSCSDLQDLYLSTAGMRMNEVMKVLTVIATIFIPLGFIAGLYGMNFNPEVSPYNMPETQWYFGYPMAIAMMVVLTVAMLAFFYRKGWLRDATRGPRG